MPRLLSRPASASGDRLLEPLPPTPRSLRTQLPAPIKAAARPLKRAHRRVTSEHRGLPDFLIIGAQKAGTTSLYTYLAAHPAILRATTKEVHFFDVHYDQGVPWYRAHFPTQRSLERAARPGMQALTGEATPCYLLHPHAPYRVRGLLPDVRMIVLLRDPVQRAISSHNHMVEMGVEDLPLAQAIESEHERLARDADRLATVPLYVSETLLHHSYLARGRYAEQLERWFSLFERDRFLILDSGRFFADPADTVARACSFLGLPPHSLTAYEPVGARDYAEVEPGLRKRLSEYFASHNDRLWDLIGDNFGWSADGS